MLKRAYQNFDLLITRTATGYNARVIESPAGEANVDFVLPFTQAELGNFFWLANHALRQLRPATTSETLPLDPKSFGTRLYEAVFADGVGKVFVRSLDAARRSDTGLRLRLRLSDTPELADLPWEYLYATDLVRHPALSDQTPLVRYLELPLAEPTLTAGLPLHVLGVVAAPSDLPPLNNDQEWTRLQTALADLQTRNLITLERLERATTAALQRRLRQGDVHILHFIGHGLFDPEQDTGGLFFETETGQSHLLSAERLGTLLHDHSALRLVFLNACEGARGGTHNVFRGVAQTLVQQGLPAVLAMQFPVSDQAAIALSHEFYKALADGYGVDAAVTEARKALYAAGDEREWGTPVLFSRSSDNQLLAGATIANSSPAVDTPGTSQIQSAGGTVIQGNVTAGGDFVGRDHVTLQIDGSVLSNSPITIHGSPAKNSASDSFITTTGFVSSEQFGLQLTKSEGIIRRLYRGLLALEDQQLFSDNKTEKATLQTQIEQQVQQLQTLLPPYVTQANQLIWQIPADIQAAIDRSLIK